MSDLFSRMVGRATGGGKSPLEPILSSRYERSEYGAARGAGSGIEGGGGESVFGPRLEMTGAGFDGARSDSGVRRGESPVRGGLKQAEGERARGNAGPESRADGLGGDKGPGNLPGVSSELAETEITAEATDPWSSTGADVAARWRADFAEDLAAAMKARPPFRVKEETAGGVGKRGESEFTRRGEVDGDPKRFSPTSIEVSPAIGQAAVGGARARPEQNIASMKEAMEPRLASREENEVSVTIGTIEVRLDPAARTPTRKAAAPKVSLEDYLGQRNFGMRDLGSHGRSGR
jgi:hypothetical protein